MWLITTYQDTISQSDGHNFSTDPLLNIIKILLTDYLTKADQLEKYFND